MSSRHLTNLDARLSPRKAVEWRARLLRMDGSVIECRAVDISSDGFGLISHMPVRLDERVQVALQFVDGKTGHHRVEVHGGTVVRHVLTSGGFRVGIKLIDRLQELLNEVR